MTAFLRKLWAFVRPYRYRMFLGLICSLFFALFNSLLPLAAKVVCDMVFAPTGKNLFADTLAKLPPETRDWLAHWLPQLQTPGSKTGLLLAIGMLPLVMFLRGAFSYLNVYLMNWAATRAIADLRVKLFDHLQNLPLAFFHDARTGNLISRVSNDTAVLHNTVAFSFATMIKDPVTVIASLILLLSLQPRLTLISLLVLPLFVLPVVIYGRKVRKSAQALQSHLADLSDVMHESFTGNRVVKAYNLENAVLMRFKEATRKFVGQYMRILRAQETPGPLIEFFGSLGIALVFVYVKFYSAAEIKPGDLLLFVGSVFTMYQPVKSISRLQNQLVQARAASKRVFELLATEDNLLEPKNPQPLCAAGADIRFDRVDFAYGEKLVLQGINLAVKSGQVVALVGASGSGKTTLTNLLLRFYDPIRGAVRVGGTDLRDVALHDLRNQIAVVTQETILFNDTIRRNIGYGRPGATDAEIEAAARHAFAHEFIMEKSGGFDALVGEKGVLLSGGQRQRLAIARAMLKNAPILILDEATSALDTESERAVQAALEELMRGRTTICIAHRLSTIQKADLIVVLECGRIVETGTHAELLQRQGVYRKLYQLQFEPATG